MPKVAALSGWIEAYSESWKKDHEDAMEYWDLCARLRLALSVYDYIRSMDEHWSELVRKGEKPLRKADAKQIIDCYSAWLRPSKEVAHTIIAVKRKGFKVIEGSEQFADACRNARFAVSVDVERAMAAEKAQVGAGRSAEQMLNELRRQIPRQRGRRLQPSTARGR